MSSRHKWALDLNVDAPRRADLKPPGDVPFVLPLNGSYLYSTSDTDEVKTRVQEADQTSLKIRKAWETAKSIRPIITTGGLAWMTPNQASLIFLSIIFTTLYGHITSIFDVQTAFAAFEDENGRYSLLPQKFVYILVQIAALGIGVYKLGKYELLPTTMADWLPWYIVTVPAEMVFGALL